jgi:hypothetical protein
VEIINLVIRVLRLGIPNAPIATLDIVNAYNTVFRSATFAAFNDAPAEFR